MSEKKEPVPAGKDEFAVAPPPASPTLVGSAQATLFVLFVLTAIGSVLAYLSALFVVHVGVGGPRLFVFVPLAVVTRLAWALSAHRSGTRDVLVHGTSAVIGAGLAALLIFVAHLPAPSSMLHHSSEVVDAKIHGDDVAVTLATKTQLLTMPPIGLLVGEVAALAGLAVAGGALIRLARRGRDDGSL
jgi:hypothetical protein